MLVLAILTLFHLPHPTPRLDLIHPPPLSPFPLYRPIMGVTSSMLLGLEYADPPPCLVGRGLSMPE